MGAYHVKVPSLHPYCSLKPLQQTPSLPVELLTTTLLYLPGTSVPVIALLYYHFLAAVRAVLYRVISKRDVCNLDVPQIFLVARRDLTAITIDSGLSPTPRTRSDGQPSLFSTRFSIPFL